MLICFNTAVFAQDFPDKIRGYKVHQTEVSVNGSKDADGLRVELEFEAPRVSTISLTGLTLELDSTVLVHGKSGTIDFLTFKDFKVNGIDVSIQEYSHSFEIEKDESVTLANPIEIFVGAGGMFKGAFSEMRSSLKMWKVSGRVFVFGRFKKFGFTFKRVIPVDVEIEIENPVKKSSNF